MLALHVHHGLSKAADAWLAAAAAQCRRWRRRGWPVSFAAQRVDGAPPAGQSIEAWARQARYAALAALAQACGCAVVLLGQHRLDQAETVLLQALRGAGPAGLAGMPRRIERHGVAFVRPWLDRPRHEIEAYVRRHRLRFVDDDSNADPRFARNRLRLQVWPSLVAAFDHAEAALAAVARRAEDAQALIDEIANADLALVAADAALHIDAWRGLSPVRRTHALLAWLRRSGATGVTSHLIERLAAELPTARSARWSVGGDELRAYRGRLRLARVAPAPPIAATRESSLRITRAGRYALPGWRGSLRVERVAEGGVPLAAIERLTLRERVGGERFQAGPRRPPRDLKRQYQAASVAAWERAGPLCFSGEQLVFVPGLGLDARVVGGPGQALVRLHWRAHDGPA